MTPPFAPVSRHQVIAAVGWLVVALLNPWMNSGRAQTPADFGFNTLPLRTTRHVLIILANYQNDPVASLPVQWNWMLFGHPRNYSVSQYMEENSNGWFGLTPAALLPISVTLGNDDKWLAIRDSKEEWKEDPTKSGEVDREFVTRIVRAAAGTGFNFSAYDANNDGVVRCPEELTLCLIDSLGGSNGGNRGIDGSVNAGGVSIAGRVITCGHNVHFDTLCHEFGHSFGIINTELYTFRVDGTAGTALNGLSIMSATGGGTSGPPPVNATEPWEPRRLHFDPWWKMRFGWSEPRIVSLRAGGRFDLPAATSWEDQAPVIVYDPNHARRYHEYFILEYRSNAQRPPNYDTSVNDNAQNAEREGMLIWHVETEDDHALSRPLWQPQDPALDHSYPDGRPFGYSSSLLARCPPDLRVWHNSPWPGGQTTPRLRWFNGTETQTRIRVLPFTPGASSITVEILPEQEVWVDFAFPGLPQYPELGNFDFPFNTLNEGISRVGYRGPLWIKAGRSAETVTGLGKPMTIHAYDGEVTLGR